jgi:hypothetical protein
MQEVQVLQGRRCAMNVIRTTSPCDHPHHAEAVDGRADEGASSQMPKVMAVVG